MNLFVNNKYTKWYFKIIVEARKNPPTGYIEKHHIVPKSLGGNNNSDNLVSLSARQHYICHLLLVKMTTGKNRSKMAYALHRTVHGNTKNLVKNSRIYQFIKEEFRKANSYYNSGEKNYFYGKRFIGELNHFYKKSHTSETKEKISKSRKGKGGRNGELNSMYGRKGELSPFYKKPRSLEVIEKIKQTKLKNPYEGDKHHKSIPVIINGVRYSSKNKARKETGLSEYMINKLAIQVK
jgi:hypothetical protein